jgi:hypothetical protein
LRCEDARRRLLAHAWDHEASRHMESCAACFEALESADPLVYALRGARPDDAPAPAGLTQAVLARRSSGGGLRVAAIAALLLAGVAGIELVTGAGPAWVGAIVGGLAAGAAGALTPLVAVRDILLGQPAALTAFSALTLGVCALWLRVAMRPPAWGRVR